MPNRLIEPAEIFSRHEPLVSESEEYREWDKDRGETRTACDGEAAGKEMGARRSSTERVEIEAVSEEDWQHEHARSAADDRRLRSIGRFYMHDSPEKEGDCSGENNS